VQIWIVIKIIEFSKILLNLINFVYRLVILGCISLFCFRQKKIDINAQSQFRIIYKGSEHSGIKSVVDTIREKIKPNAKVAILNLDDKKNDNLKKLLITKKSIDIFIGNPEIIFKAFFYLRFSIFNNINIGLWFWELESTPKYWTILNKVIDLNLTQSEFTHKIFKSMSKKITKIPFKVYVPGSIDLKKCRKSLDFLNLPSKKFIFYFNFDFLSSVYRKNPFILIKSFQQAFKYESDILLVIRSINGDLKSNEKLNLINLCKKNKNIIYFDQVLSRDESLCLLNLSHCYISLHRSEGLGLNIAEAMLSKKPVIATNYSGNLEFMNKSNSFLVDYKLVKVKPGEYLFSKSQWAEVDEDGVIKAMKDLYSNQSLRSQLVNNGYNDIKSLNKDFDSFEITKRWLKKILH